jgi:signal transduction histidine kinase
MDYKIEPNKTDTHISSESDKLLSSDPEESFVNENNDPIKILYFSKLSSSDRWIFDSVSYQIKTNWGLYEAENIEEVIAYIYQYEINLVLIYQASFSIEDLNILSGIGVQIDAPILAIVDQENEAIAATAFSIGAQDYITLEEVQSPKILQRTIQHVLIGHRWKIKQHESLEIIPTDQGNLKQCETDLRGSEERFRLLGDCVPFGIFQTDFLGSSVYTNLYLQKFCESNSEMNSSESWIENLHPDDRFYLQNIGALEFERNPGQSWMNSIHPDDRWKVLQSFENFIQGVGSFHCEFRLIRCQEDIRWVVSHGIALTPTNGEPVGYAGTITDITVHKQAEENLKQLNIKLENRVFERTSDLQQANLELRIGNKIREFHETERKKAERALYKANDQLQAVLDAVPGCVAWVSADLNYLGVNQLMAKAFQLEVQDFVGKKIGFIKSNAKEYIGFIKQFFLDSEDNINEELEFEFNGEQKKHYWLIGQKYDQGRAAVFVAIEITERKRAEIETQNALEKVKELSDLKSRFIFMVSHEFRTPLTSIFTASELLEHYGHKWPPEKVLQYLKQIQESVQRMNGLLEDVLIIGAGEVGKLKLQPTELDIVDFCQHLIEEARLSRQNRHVFNFSHDAQIQRVFLDAKLLRHILSNLLSNSIKYSPEKKPIDFNLWVDGTQINFQVVDYGIGIPLKDQKHLFELFHRATNVGSIGGTGIGLSIVKKSVDALGGRISFESSVNSGSKFTVSIPINQVKGEYQW